MQVDLAVLDNRTLVTVISRPALFGDTGPALRSQLGTLPDAGARLALFDMFESAYFFADSGACIKKALAFLATHERLAGAEDEAAEDGR